MTAQLSPPRPAPAQGPRSTSARPSRPARPSYWSRSLLLLVAVAVCAAGFTGVLDGIEWWFVVTGEALLVLLAAAIARAASARRWVPTAVAAIVGVGVTTLFFTPTTAFLGVIPTFDSIEFFSALARTGSGSIATQGIPANPVAGIVFLFAIAVAGIAILLDLVAITLGRPAVAGLPLFVLLVAPSIVDPELADPFFFLLVAVLFLLLLYSGAATRQGARATAVGALAIIGSLVLSIVLPPVDSNIADANRGLGYTTGINPIITLGDDLRRAAPITAISYTTDAEEDQYFTLTVLDDFTGTTWEPESVPEDTGTEVSAIPTAPGREDVSNSTATTTKVELGNIQGRWLPVPYAPSKVTGLVGDWYWVPETLSIRSNDSSIRSQKYSVTTDTFMPTVDQLEAAGTRVPNGLEKYLVVPADLPSSVGAEASRVVGDAESNFDKAIKLQSYFQSNAFTYSVDAPVESGYDGSGATVIAKFLEEKAGYCVHFSSAMAAMARTLGIPSRIAVGFTSGRPILENSVVRNVVTTDDLHAWPELYFADLGWVRFEPTPGRGTIPDFQAAPVDDPNTPQNEATPTPTPTPTTTPQPTADPQSIPNESTPTQIAARANTTTLVSILVALALLAILLVPFAIRRSRRVRRLGAVRRYGTALAGWQEIVDTAQDLGWPVDGSTTPREADRQLRQYVDRGAYPALERVRTAVEAQAFAGEAATSTGGGPLAADVGTVRSALRSGTGFRGIRATFLPASVVGRWITLTPRQENGDPAAARDPQGSGSRRSGEQKS